MGINENMRPQEANLLSMTRAVIIPGQVMLFPKVFMEINILPSIRKTDVLIYTVPEMGAQFLEYQLIVHPEGQTESTVNNGVQNFFFVIEGTVEFTVAGKEHTMSSEGYLWLPPGTEFAFRNRSDQDARMLWLRKEYVPTPYYPMPDPIISSVNNVQKVQKVAEIEQQLLPFEANLGFDFAMNMLTFMPGITFPRTEAHCFEHGAYFLDGRGYFWINERYYEVHVDDFSYFAPFVPHFVMANGPGPLRYLLYKNVNRDYPVPRAKEII